MGMSKTQWTTMAQQASALLGGTWATAPAAFGGTILYRCPVGWRLDFIAYQPTTVGELYGKTTWILEPLDASSSYGASTSIRARDFDSPGQRKQSGDWFTVETVAQWAANLAEYEHTRRPVMNDWYLNAERQIADPRLAGNPPTLLALAGYGLLLNKGTVAEQSDRVESYITCIGPLADARPIYGDRIEYWRVIAEHLRRDDRDAAIDIMRENRMRQLTTAYGIPEHLITPDPTPEDSVRDIPADPTAAITPNPAPPEDPTPPARPRTAPVSGSRARRK